MSKAAQILRTRRVQRVLILLLFIVAICWLSLPRDRRQYRHAWKDATSFVTGGDWQPPPIRDPFPLLAETDGPPPPIPYYNRPAPDAWRAYSNLTVAPPLIIGFTRSWPLLLQTVVSYVTAGWPPEDIYVVENTGAQQSNARGLLTLQHPFYLNHTTLHRLGVNVVQTPTLLTFAQLMNFYHAMTYEHNWPYYFWSHMDVLALSYEGGNEHTPAADQPGYKSLYTLSLEALNETVSSDDPKWANRFFSYDHLCLTNPLALEDVGGWDTFISYYFTDCDLYSRFNMRGWNQADSRAGIISDVAMTLEDLAALYRLDGVSVDVMDPNPTRSSVSSSSQQSNDNEERGEAEKEEEKQRRGLASDLYDSLKFGGGSSGDGDGEAKPEQQQGQGDNERPAAELIAYWEKLKTAAEEMAEDKLEESRNGRGRNKWQMAQRGGQDEPYHVDADGFQRALDRAINTGKRNYWDKWSHGNCDLINGAGRTYEEQWQI